MSRPRGDDRIREAIQQLRAEVAEAGRVPDFRRMLDRAKRDAETREGLHVVPGTRPTRPRWRVAAWASVAAAAALAGVLFTTSGPNGEEEFAQLVAAYSSGVSGGAWQSPTSRLMNVPGMELTRSVPSVGGAARGIDPATLPPPPPRTEENG